MSRSSGAGSDASGRLRAGHEAARLEIARLSVAGPDALPAAIVGLSQIAARVLEVQRVGVWSLDAPRHVLRCDHLFDATNGEVYSGAVLHVRDFPNYFAALDRVCAIPAHEAEVDPVTRELTEAYLKPLGVVSMLDAPIHRGGRVTGVVCAENVRQVRTWSHDDYEFAAFVAATLARLFEEADRHSALRSLEQVEARLVHQRQLETLGSSTAAIAHDFRAVLGAVLGFARLIQLSPDARGEVGELAGQVLAAGERGRALCSTLLEYGAAGTRKPTILDLGRVLTASAPVLRQAAGPELQLELQVAPRVSRVFIDERQFERALLNLVCNARDASPPGATVWVRLREGRAPPPGEEPSVVVEVEDRGAGMTPEVRARMFEPFYTTKGQAGFGLGAAVVDQVVSLAGGNLEVLSAPGQGTTVRLYFPRIAACDAGT